MAGEEFAPDFWRYYGNKTLSDVKLIIREELSVAGTRGKRKKPLEEEIVAHGIVLSSFSGYCRTKLEAWDNKDTDQIDDKQREILMPVPEGQLDIGQLLVKCMYQQPADLAGIDQVKLIHLLLLADRYEVPKVEAVVSAAFCNMPLADLQWDTAMMMYGLPAGCVEIDACKDLYVTAAAKVQQQLGDLETIWSDQENEKQKILQQLPFAAFKQLLQDKRTRVSSENTVHHTIQRWHQYQVQQKTSTHQCTPRQKPKQGPSLLELSELLQLIRMQHCSHWYLTTVMGSCPLITGCFNHLELLLACSCSITASNQSQQPPDNLPVLQRYPAWLLPKRPASAMSQLVIDWKLSLVTLKSAFQLYLLQKAKDKAVPGPSHTWQAVATSPMLIISTTATPSSHGGSGSRSNLLTVVQPSMNTVIGFHAKAHLESANALRQMTCTFSAETFKQGCSKICYTGRRSVLLTGRNDLWGYKSFIELGHCSCWADAEMCLRQRGLVGNDNCLHLKLQVLEIL